MVNNLVPAAERGTVCCTVWSYIHPCSCAIGCKATKKKHHNKVWEADTVQHLQCIPSLSVSCTHGEAGNMMTTSLLVWGIFRIFSVLPMCRKDLAGNQTINPVIGGRPVLPSKPQPSNTPVSHGIKRQIGWSCRVARNYMGAFNSYWKVMCQKNITLHSEWDEPQ